MPHLVLDGSVDLDRVASGLDPGVVRWGRAVIKTGDRWLREDGLAVLVEGVVVELSRPLHPVAIVTPRDAGTSIRLWPVVDVERTPAVRRWLAVLAAKLQALGAGPVRTTNLAQEILDGLDLDRAVSGQL
jgi:hypothetical protein